MWKGKDPNPEEAVENWDAVDNPRKHLSGGAGISAFSSMAFGVNVCFANGEDGAVDAVNVCCTSGDTGGVLIGRLDIGEGETKGNDSKIESVRVEVEDKTEEPEIRLPGSCACA